MDIQLYTALFLQ